MLPATIEETKHVTDYMVSQAPDLQVTFVQKVYSENILGHVHEVWDVHTNKDRWWVITNPMNLYSQDQFPNMDIAVTFHVGLCIRIPRTDRAQPGSVAVEPFASCYRQITDANESLLGAQEVNDFQAIGVRCREMLLAFTNAAQAVFPWDEGESAPKAADFKAWSEHVCNRALPGSAHEHRRHLLKTLFDTAWKFSNWLTHAKQSTWYDAEAAVSITENALTASISTILRILRGVPEQCPNCGSNRLTREVAENPGDPEEMWERPSCQKCGWTGEATRVKPPRSRRKRRARKSKPSGECSIQSTPLRNLKRPT
jgi:hypothetical protein